PRLGQSRATLCLAFRSRWQAAAVQTQTSAPDQQQRRNPAVQRPRRSGRGSPADLDEQRAPATWRADSAVLRTWPAGGRAGEHLRPTPGARSQSTYTPAAELSQAAFRFPATLGSGASGEPRGPTAVNPG